ncbi:Crp/Fnr family transcriptional regulator [Pedobacter ureilyticus]|uniref:Crp/Fnr family transcriptional regulator n=1 Tax=Pedobacter ureilyticus TaxID=1393051 RepID=A0ABW9J8A4_9SPHI|nr:Crp/Fnr family transcriptional regulator [Pedobacter helvus]
MHEQLNEYIRKKISISDENLQMVNQFFKPLELKKNEFLLHTGETCQRTYFVLEGCLRIFFINEAGQDATRYLAFENQFATGLVSFITEQPSFEYVQAVAASKILYISRYDFYALLKVVPEWERFYRSYLEFAYVLNTTRLMSFLTLDATERYKRLLDESPEIFKRLPNKLVASYLNMSQETLSRVKSKR